MSDIFIVGIDMIKFGKYPGKTPAQLGGEAALLALDDAGLTIHDVQAVYSGSNFTTMIGQRILQQIGQTGIQVVNVINACATGGTAIREAYTAIKAREYDVVLAVGAEQTSSMGLLGASKPGPILTEGLWGSASMPAVFSEAGQEYAAKYGITQEQFAQVAVKNHHHSTLNPKAYFQKETPLEQVLDAEMISYPNTKLMCSINVDGAAAAVLVSERKARALGLMGRAIRIRASAIASDPFQKRNPTMPDINSCTRLAADKAYDVAGLGPEDLDLVELHDCFATAELQHYDNLRLCADGGAGELLDSGATAIGGRIPVNLSGGLLSKGHPIAATGIANICEVALHLRGEAGARQVPNARIGLTHVVGLGTCSAVHILERA